MSAAPRPPAPGRTIAIRHAHPRLRCPRGAVARVLHTLEAHLPALRLPPGAVPPGELSIAFLTDRALARLHANYLADPTPTDVITFGGDPAAGTAGEICLSVDRARAFARAAGHAFATELTLYLVHGWLHLAGHDDLVPAAKRRMRAAERRCLALLRAHRALPAFRFATR